MHVVRYGIPFCMVFHSLGGCQQPTAYASLCHALHAQFEHFKRVEHLLAIRTNSFICFEHSVFGTFSSWHFVFTFRSVRVHIRQICDHWNESLLLEMSAFVTRNWSCHSLYFAAVMAFSVLHLLLSVTISVCPAWTFNRMHVNWYKSFGVVTANPQITTYQQNRIEIHRNVWFTEMNNSCCVNRKTKILPHFD